MERRERRQVDEVYTIKQVAEMTGVPDNTIRSWERRFGIPSPGRSGTNQRRYDNHDIQAIRAIQAARDRGRTMEQAIADLEISRSASELDVPTPPGPFPPVDVSPRFGARPVADSELLAALLKLDTGLAEIILSDAIVSTSIDQSCFSELNDLDRRLGLVAAEGTAEPAHVRFAREWIARKLWSIFDLSNPESGRSHIAIAAMYDDSARTLALCMAIVISRAGYRVSWAGSAVPPHEVEPLLDQAQPAALMLVASSHLSQRAALASAKSLSAGSNSACAVVTVGIDEVGFPGMIQIEPSATAAVRDLDAALAQSRSTSIHVMRKQ